MSAAKKPFDPIKASDSECWNCVGVSFLSDNLAKKGEKPTCFGIQYKASVRISDEAMKKLEEIPVVPPNSKILIFGLSQSSTRMHRHGQVPVVKYGIPVVLKYYVIKEETQNQISYEEKGKIQKQFEKENIVESKRLLTKDRSDTISSEARKSKTDANFPIAENAIRRTPNPSDQLIFPKLSNLIQTSSVKLFSNTCKISQTLPTRLQKSAERIKGSVSNRLNLMWMRLQQQLAGDDSSKQK